MMILAAPDFFLDIIARFDGSFDKLLRAVRETFERRGGNVRLRAVLRPGGNAANSARVLSALGAATTLAVVGSPLVAQFAQLMLGGNIDVVHLGGDGVCVSYILEVESVNIMFSDKSCLSSLGVDQRVTSRLAELTGKGWDACLLVNVAAWGDPLEALRKVKACRIVLLDPSDLRGVDVRRIIRAFKEVDAEIKILGVNENEAKQIADYYGVTLRQALRILATETSSIACMHTPRYTHCEPLGLNIENPWYTKNPATVTGAGDAWNAGLLYALTHGENLESAIRKAMLVASCYVRKGAPCTPEELERSSEW